MVWDSPIGNCFVFRVSNESLACENLTDFAIGRASAMFTCFSVGSTRVTSWFLRGQNPVTSGKSFFGSVSQTVFFGGANQQAENPFFFPQAK